MKNNLNEEIAKMRSLMSRIETPHTNYQAMINEAMFLNEANNSLRKEFNDLIQLLYDDTFNKYKCVSLGYVMDASTIASVFPNEENQAELDNVLNANKGQEWTQKLSDVRNNPKWAKIMSGKSKSLSFRSGGLSLIVVMPYTIQWQNGEKFNKWYNERMRAEDEIDKKWGRDPLEKMKQKEENKKKQEDRIFYVGDYKNGDQPVYSARYGDYKDGKIARYADGSERLALKQVKTNLKAGKPRYFYLNKNGEYVDISNNVVYFLSKKLGKNTAKKIIDNVEEKAESYENELRAYKSETSNLIQQFLLRQVGYIVGTITDLATGKKESVAYVNKNVDASEASKPFFVNAQALYPKLQQMAHTVEQEQ